MYYTKYRPQKFTQISKPNDAAAALINQVKLGKLAHAYLFIGPRGTGKTTTARILAKALNCEKLATNGDPCDKCKACTSVKTDSFLDLIEIDAASNRGIDDIRSLREKVKLAPSLGRQKVYIIDEVHMLTNEAFNALLKTLEEPPLHATFILCTTEDHKVPDTIKSRCQVYKFKRASVDQLVEKLLSIVKSEKLTITKEELKKIAEAAHGGFRDAENILEQVCAGGLSLESFVGTISKKTYVDFVFSIYECEVSDALRLINNLYDDGIDLFVWSMGLLGYLRDLLFISADSHEGLVDTSPEVFSSMEEQASKFDPQELVHIIEVFMEAQNSVKSSTIAQLPLELAVVKVCHPTATAVKEPISNPKEPEESTTIPHTNTSKNSSVSLEDVQKKWSKVLKNAVSHNNSLHALLKSGKPVEIVENKIKLEVSYKFHKERLESTKNREIVDTILTEIFDEPVTLSCVVCADKIKAPVRGKKTEELTDYNVSVPVSGEKFEGELSDFFDGSLPL